MKEFRMSYRGHVCGWFKDCGCLFFAKSTEAIKHGDYDSYDVRALTGLKKAFKEKVDEIEGEKIKGQKYPTEQWSV